MKVDPAVRARYALVVVDTNVLLSAALSPSGVPATLVDQLLTLGRLVFSEATFAELDTRVWQPKFDRYLPIERRRRILLQARAAAVWVDIPLELARRTFSRDAKDDAFVQTAIAAGATRLVTGDDDLLCLHPLDSEKWAAAVDLQPTISKSDRLLDTLHILTPRQSLDELQTGKP